MSVILRLGWRLLSAAIQGPYVTGLILFRFLVHGYRVWTFSPATAVSRRPGQAHRSISLPPPVSFTKGGLPIEDVEPYIYPPLPGERYIRLLELKSQRGNPGIVEVELHSFSLDDPLLRQAYRAISYSWDGQVAERPILVGGCSLTVTANCETLLRDLPRVGRVFLWIDAVCIDQGSSEERSSQVPLMAEIYTYAFIVTVWLGPAAPDGGSALAFSYLWLYWCCASLPGALRQAVSTRLRIHILRNGHGAYLRELLRRGWWRRVWTLQESVLAKEPTWYGALVANCGPDLEMPLDIIAAGLIEFTAVHEYGLNKYPLNTLHWTHCMMAHYMPRRSLDTRTGDESRNFDLARLMNWSRACGAADPRDKVYGVFGVLVAMGLHLPPPSYLMAKDTVYWEATVAACEQSGSLELLTLVTSDEPALDGPSWVPDYSQPFRPADLAFRGDASGGSSAALSFNQAKTELTASGRVIDIVKAKSELTIWHPPPEGDMPIDDDILMNLTEGYQQTISALRDWYRIMVEKGLLNQYDTYEGLFRAMGEVLTLGMIRSVVQPVERVDEFFKRWVAFVQSIQGIEDELLARAREDEPDLRAAFFDRPDGDAGSWQMLGDDAWQTLVSLKTDPTTRVIHHMIWMLMRDRAFFVTQRGYMGTAPTSTREDDLVMLLAGVGRPVIARYIPDTGKFRIICSAFIEGIMTGERWNDAAGSIVDFTFV